MTVAIQDNVSTTMDCLYERLLQHKFMTSNEAINYCRETCLEYGFTVKNETGANRSIYIYCSREDNRQQTPLLRKRSLKNDCKWRIVLNSDEYGQWVFRKSLNPTGSEHNHAINSMVDVWPQQVLDKISLLSRQNQTTEEIRDCIKLEFPDITWNDRRFHNFVSLERKKIKQKSITERVQNLIMASTKLCSVVAANEDWASCVENDLTKMLDNYRQITRLSNQSLNSMVDLELDMIHSEIDKRNRSINKDQLLDSKKQKTSHNNLDAVQIMSIPSCTLFIRSQPLRSLSEPSQNRPHPLNTQTSFNTPFQQNSNDFTTFDQHRSNFNNNIGYYGRESSPSLQQRMMLQEYEQRQLQNNNTTLPIIL
ncbi:hypothetical protein INT48_006360 [Thamnidium elegans]|uniref:FAR1 domain-containing protein n=1 Tax=Thamnidium elegans TaxID=101142 RepID=A0A8H7SIG2_9FUNG|nr:hypothetical protein INT48_006360 [Thamnidium elegans]